jgi:predicted N-acetyltransferase YhbS
MSQSLDFRIRSLQPSDSIAELTAMIRSAYAPHAENGLRFVGTYQDERTTAERLAAGHGLVAESERGLVGTVVVRPPQPTSSAALYRDPDTWSVGQLAVLPEWQGRGLGRALHDAAVDLARRNGARAVALDTAAAAKALISLYERWGYRIAGTADWRPRTNYDSVLMLREFEADACVGAGAG